MDATGNILNVKYGSQYKAAGYVPAPLSSLNRNPQSLGSKWEAGLGTPL